MKYLLQFDAYGFWHRPPVPSIDGIDHTCTAANVCAVSIDANFQEEQPGWCGQVAQGSIGGWGLSSVEAELAAKRENARI